MQSASFGTPSHFERGLPDCTTPWPAPRVINLICDNLLVTAFAMKGKTCTLEMLDEVCQDLRLEWPGSNRDRRGRSRYGLEEDHFPDSITARSD